MVNRSEEKVRIHMNVVPRRTGTQIVEQRIGHVRYINIQAWLRGFRIKIANF